MFFNQIFQDLYKILIVLNARCIERRHHDEAMGCLLGLYNTTSTDLT
jgi:hypothetical protein